jgi:hypothetical protein
MPKRSTVPAHPARPTHPVAISGAPNHHPNHPHRSHRELIPIGKLLPNPFKKEVLGGELDPLKVAQIKQSADKTSLWEQWVARRTEAGYELAFGHHRLQAAIELYGPKYQASVQIEAYTDSQMLMAMVNENAKEESTLLEQDMTLAVVREYLRAHPEECRQAPAEREAVKPRGRPQGCAIGDHGSAECVVAFLGKKNWGLTKVTELLAVHERLDATIYRMVDKERAAYGVITPGKIGIQSAAAIAQLEKPAQRAAGEIIHKAGEERERDAKNRRYLIRRQVITPEQVRHAVKRAKAATRDLLKQNKAKAAEHQSRIVTEEMDRAIKQNIREAELERAKDGNQEALRIAERLYAAIPKENEMETLIAARHLIEPFSKRELENALEDVAQRLLRWHAELRKAPALRLMAGKARGAGAGGEGTAGR